MTTIVSFIQRAANVSNINAHGVFNKDIGNTQHITVYIYHGIYLYIDLDVTRRAHEMGKAHHVWRTSMQYD